MSSRSGRQIRVFTIFFASAFVTGSAFSFSQTPMWQTLSLPLDAVSGLLGMDAAETPSAAQATGAVPPPTAAAMSASEDDLPFVAASLSPMIVKPHRAGPEHAEDGHNVMRRTKGDRLTIPAMTVDNFLPADDPAQAEGASAALFLFSPDMDEIAAASERPPRPTWDDLVSLAKTGGDGNRSMIFGGLSEAQFRARELRCMATAIYFEARGESRRGQLAVGQVIMNRIRSDFYPDTICGVVFHGERRRTGCQFSFTCDGHSDRPKDAQRWKQAIDAARDVISGKARVDAVGDATHYHATYVRPPWRRKMTRLTRIGTHVFYKAPYVDVQLAESLDADS